MQVCPFHGGNTPRGTASPNYKHGLRSKHMPQGLRLRYSQAMEDPSLLSLDRDVALVESRLMELLAELKNPEGNWSAVKRGAQQIMAARGSGDATALREALDGLLAAINAGDGLQNRWLEIGGLIEARRRIIDTIGKQQIRAQEALTLDRASVLFTALARAVTRNVADKASLERVLVDFNQIVGKESVPIQAQLMAEREGDVSIVK
jgi:hypothetical protein